MTTQNTVLTQKKNETERKRKKQTGSRQRTAGLVLSTWMGDRLTVCLSVHWSLVGRPSRYITGHLSDNSAFHPYEVGKSMAGVKAGCVHLCQMEGTLCDPKMASDTP